MPPPRTGGLAHLPRHMPFSSYDLITEPQNLGAILEAIPDLLFELGLDGRYYSYQAPREDLLTAPPERLLGRRVTDVMSAEAAAVVMAALHEAHQYGRSTGKQLTLLLPHGLSWFELSVARKTPQPGQGPRFIVLSRDITASKHTEDALRQSRDRERSRSDELATLLDVAPTAVWIAHDPQCKLITGNKLAAQWLGVEDGINVSPAAIDHARVWGCKILKDGVELAPHEMPLQRAAAGEEIADYEFDIVYPDGRTRHVLGNAVPLRGTDQRIDGAVTAFIDITARKDAENLAQEARQLAEHSNIAKSRFLAAASHDLRQPLSALGIYVNLLKGEVLPSGQKILANMSDCLGSLSELLNDLLDLSKLDAGVVVPNVSTFSLSELFANLASIHEPEAQLKNLRYKCRASTLTAHTDPVLFKRIIDNLISNAIRYTQSGGVLVACRRRGGKHWVEVRDSGVGIHPEHIIEIFEEFRQLDGGARNRGSGLGLAIVAKTAQLLGLEISVRSSPGLGSVFAIEFPPGPALTPPSHPAATSEKRRLCIALVEDNGLVREALTLGLQAAGHRVIAATSGPVLGAALGAQVPDIVISDYRLADGETGYDVIDRLRKLVKPDLPALLVTGDTDPLLIRSMADRGIVVLHKPLEMETVEAYLEDLTYQSH